MKIIYLAQPLSRFKTGASQVMSRNLRALKLIAGDENVYEYYLPPISIKSVILSLFRLRSYGITKQTEDKFLETVEKIDPDVVFVESSCYGSIYERLREFKCKTICFAHNLDTELCRQEITSRNPLIGIPKYISAKINEKKCCKCVDLLICLSVRDSDGFKKMFGRGANVILPITFPERELEYNKQNISPYFLFVGSNFFPNIEGIKWFIQNVAPHINADIHLVGSCCENSIIRQLNLPKNVYLIGYTENLESEYVGAAGVIAPIFKGSGMKTKTIEALSYSKSIFGTSEAFAGIDCNYNQIGALCNSADEFIASLTKHSGQIYNEYSQKLFREKYSDQSFICRFSKALNDLAK
ncbi:MAG: glycosyltransferase family 4 protein [Bacteroides sp.]|nr:glycosyltransferase family 4 protein [Bacteroides sp.]